MPAESLLLSIRRSASLASLVLLAACTHLGAVRDFGKSAAVVSTYPTAATAYVDSAVISAPYLVVEPVGASPQPFVARPQRQQQAADALALQAVLGDYFATLARLAGADIPAVATLKSMGSDVKALSGGGVDRTTLDAGADLVKTLGDYALQPARERAVEGLVRDGGPNAMRILQALRGVATDWRAQVANDARQVDDTLGVAVLASDVPPLLRILATDRQAELARSYAATLRKMSALERALAAVALAHQDMVQHLDELGGEPLRVRLEAAVAELRQAGETLAAVR